MRIGIVTKWFNRGQPVVGRQLRSAVEASSRSVAGTSGAPAVFHQKDPKTGRRRNLGTFGSRAAAERHERAVQFFTRH